MAGRGSARTPRARPARVLRRSLRVDGQQMTQRTIAKRFVLTIAATLVGACSIAGPSRAVVAAPPAALGAHAVTFASKSGSVIHGWLARGRVHGGVVLLLHGMGANRMAM